MYGIHDYDFGRRRLLGRKAVCKANIGLQCLSAFGWDESGDGDGRLRGRDICAFGHDVVVKVGCDVGRNGFSDVQGNELLLEVRFRVFWCVSVVMSVATMVQHTSQLTYPKRSTTAFFAVSRTPASASSRFATNWLE